MPSAERFWRHVDRSGGPDACWPWRAHLDAGNYGCFVESRRTVKAHRMAWILTNGPIPAGAHHGTTCVLHRCDNPPCCNPAHLFLGTQVDNIKDMEAKGRKRVARGDESGSRRRPERLARGDANGSRKHPERLKRGVDSANAKIDDDTARTIFASTERLVVVAARYGVSVSLVCAIRKRRVWRHATESIVAARCALAGLGGC